MQFTNLVECLEASAKNPKRLEKSLAIAKFLYSVPVLERKDIILLIQGKVFPEYDQTKLGISVKLLLKAIAQTAGVGMSDVEGRFNALGDVGLVAEQLLVHKQQQTLFSTSLEVVEVISTLRKLPTFEGTSSTTQKLSVIAGMLGNATPLEARYLCNMVADQLRAGVAQGVLRDAIVWSVFPSFAAAAYPDLDFSWAGDVDESASGDEKSLAELQLIIKDFQRAIDFLSGVSEAAELLYSGGLDAVRSVSLKLFRPFHVMLAQKVTSIADAQESIGPELVAEYKYDGFRIQIHKQGSAVRLFTRRLEEVTMQFPDVVCAIVEHIKEETVILDAEVIGIDASTANLDVKKYLPFQAISQRIRRKYNIDELAQKFPVEVRVFDVLLKGNDLLFEVPLSERRALLEQIVPVTKSIAPSAYISTDSEDEIASFYQTSLDAGNEGIMLKSKDSPYQPGARVGFMLKYKPTMENLDLVVVSATRGEGKRSSWLTSYTVACRNEFGELVELGKVSTGLKELSSEGTSFEDMTNLLLPLIVKDEGKEVRVQPEVVIEVAYEELQKSMSYSSGFALRFPRFVLLRDDRGIDDVSDVRYVELLYDQQRGRGE